MTDDWPFDDETMEKIYLYVTQRWAEDYKAAVEAVGQIQAQFEADMAKQGEELGKNTGTND